MVVITPEPAAGFHDRQHTHKKGFIMESMNLYEIRQEIIDLINPTDPETNEPLDLEADAVTDRIKTLDMNIDMKAQNSIAYIKNLRSYEKALDTEIKRLQAMKKSTNNKWRGLAGFVQEVIEIADRHLNLGIHKARLQKNSQLTVIIMDENLVPDRFVKFKKEVKKAEIGAWHKETGEIIAGVEIVEGQHLRLS